MVELRLNLLYRYGKLIFGFCILTLIIHLWVTVRHLSALVERLTNENERLSSTSKAGQTLPPVSWSHPSAELFLGKSYSTEMDMPRFSMFTTEWMYLVDPGLGKRVVERLFGSKREDLLQVIAAGNAHVKTAQMKNLSFAFGIVRFLPRDGMHYELIYKDKKQSDFVHRLTFTRPLGNLSLVLPTSPPPSTSPSAFDNPISLVNPVLHFVVAASPDRLPNILSFIEYHFVIFGKERISTLNIDLTLVVFLNGQPGVDGIRNAIKGKLDQLGFALSVHIVPVTSANFSRGLGLHSGIVDVAKRDPNPLIFTTDVDVVVTSLFINRCRLNAQSKRRVYFPVVYSLYNPHIVYPYFLNRTVPSAVREFLNIHDETGWWRDFGYGMTCFYKTDYDSVGGFGRELTHLHGWGSEDVGLFRKFVRSKLMVVRSVDPGIFHLYHKKECDAGDIGNARYRACVASRAYNEASHAQLGVMCLKDGAELV